MTREQARSKAMTHALILAILEGRSEWDEIDTQRAIDEFERLFPISPDAK